MRRVLLAALLMTATVAHVAGADFSYAKIRTGATGAEAYFGAVTLVSPFGDKPDAAIPIFLLVDPGDFQTPWSRAQHVAEVLPKATELLLYRGEFIKIRPDPDGNPALVVGPIQDGTGADLRIVSVLPGDVERFQLEEKGRGSNRIVTAEMVAEYWQTLLVEYVTLFIRYPMTREEDILNKLRLVRTKEGSIFKRVLIEVGVLLKYDNIPENKIDSTLLRSKIGEVIRSMSQDQFAAMTGLAFRIPAEFEASGARGGRLDTTTDDRGRGMVHSPESGSF